MNPIRFLVAFLALFFLGMSGCGPKNPIESYYIEGTVVFDGEPIVDAKLVFYPKDTTGSETAFANTVAGGRYTVTSSNGLPGYGAMAGDYIVTVSWMDVKRLNPGKEPPEFLFTEKLPEVYQDEENSPLSVTIEKKRKNVVDLVLTKNQ